MDELRAEKQGLGVGGCTWALCVYYESKGHTSVENDGHVENSMRLTLEENLTSMGMRLSESLPRLTVTNFFITCVVVTIVIFIGVASRIDVFVYPMGISNSPDMHSSASVERPGASKSSDLPGFNFRVAASGETIQIEGLTVDIATVVHNDEYPAKYGFNIFMNGWVRHNTTTSFQCCLLRSLPNGTLVDDVITEVRSYTYHIYTQWIVDRQNAEFSCSVSSKQIADIGDANFSYVTFAKDTCLKVPIVVLPILQPKPVFNSVCVCLKITYGHLKPEKVIEWFEYTWHMGVTKVFTYYAEVSPEVLKVLQYYQKIGFLEMIPIQPAVSADGKINRFRRPRFEQQAWVDEVMAANDCKYRMAKYDYIIIMDMDEFIVPKGNMTSYFDILQATSQMMPDPCGYSFDVHVAMLDWGATRSSPLNICSYTNRTEMVNYDGADRNTRWAFRPNLTYWVQNNLIHCKSLRRPAPTPRELYTLLHYRSCKPEWIGCDTKPRVNDTIMLKYELPLIDQILRLPLKELVPDYDKYISSLEKWKENNINST